MFAALNYKYTCKGVEKSRILNREDRSTEIQGRKGMPGVKTKDMRVGINRIGKAKERSEEE